MGAWTDVVGWDVVGINKRKKKKKDCTKRDSLHKLKGGTDDEEPILCTAANPRDFELG